MVQFVIPVTYLISNRQLQLKLFDANKNENETKLTDSYLRLCCVYEIKISITHSLAPLVQILVYREESSIHWFTDKRKYYLSINIKNFFTTNVKGYFYKRYVCRMSNWPRIRKIVLIRSCSCTMWTVVHIIMYCIYYYTTLHYTTILHCLSRQFLLFNWQLHAQCGYCIGLLCFLSYFITPTYAMYVCGMPLFHKYVDDFKNYPLLRLSIIYIVQYAATFYY